jgi:hypothetical protein
MDSSLAILRQPGEQLECQSKLQYDPIIWFCISLKDKPTSKYADA